MMKRRDFLRGTLATLAFPSAAASGVWAPVADFSAPQDFACGTQWGSYTRIGGVLMLHFEVEATDQVRVGYCST